MADTLLIERGIGEIRIAEIDDGQVVAFGFENPMSSSGCTSKTRFMVRSLVECHRRREIVDLRSPE